MRFLKGIGFWVILLLMAACGEKPREVAKQVKQTVFRSPIRAKKDTVYQAEHFLYQSFFRELHRKGFNGNVLVARKNKVLYQGSWGYADIPKKDTLCPSSRFQLASVSKQFTAVAIMKLKEEGKLDYNDPIQKFIPEFPYAGINIHLLLSHRSGLPNYFYFCDHFCSDHNTPISNNEVIGLMASKKPELYFKPDRRFQYCNTNYCLLASIVERVSGIKYRDYLQKNLFKPAGMYETLVFSLIDSTFVPASVKGHYANGRYLPYNYLNGVVGDKGVYSTVYDLFLWDKALNEGKIIKKETLEQAYLPTSALKRDGGSYGYGWRLKFLEDGTKVVFHGGWWQGFKSCYMRIPKDDTFIVILTNVANKGFSLGTLLDAYSLITPGFDNPYSNQKFSRDSISF